MDSGKKKFCLTVERQERFTNYFQLVKNIKTISKRKWRSTAKRFLFSFVIHPSLILIRFKEAGDYIIELTVSSSF